MAERSLKQPHLPPLNNITSQPNGFKTYLFSLACITLTTLAASCASPQTHTTKNQQLKIHYSEIHLKIDSLDKDGVSIIATSTNYCMHPESRTLISCNEGFNQDIPIIIQPKQNNANENNDAIIIADNITDKEGIAHFPFTTDKWKETPYMEPIAEIRCNNQFLDNRRSKCRAIDLTMLPETSARLVISRKIIEEHEKWISNHLDHQISVDVQNSRQQLINERNTRANELIDMADRAIKERNFHLARELYKECITIHPAYTHCDELDSRITTNKADLYHKNAQEKLNEGDMESAQEIATSCLELMPNHDGCLGLTNTIRDIETERLYTGALEEINKNNFIKARELASQCLNIRLNHEDCSELESIIRSAEMDAGERIVIKLNDIGEQRPLPREKTRQVLQEFAEHYGWSRYSDNRRTLHDIAEYIRNHNEFPPGYRNMEIGPLSWGDTVDLVRSRFPHCKEEEYEALRNQTVLQCKGYLGELEFIFLLTFPDGKLTKIQLTKDISEEELTAKTAELARLFETQIGRPTTQYRSERQWYVRNSDGGLSLIDISGTLIPSQNISRLSVVLFVGPERH